MELEDAKYPVRNEPVLTTRNLTKKYHKELAVNQVSMSIKSGDIYGFIGENGAGKTITYCGMIGCCGRYQYCIVWLEFMPDFTTTRSWISTKGWNYSVCPRF